MKQTFSIKWEEKILVTSKNKDSFDWYKFIQEEMSEKQKDIKNFLSLKNKAKELRTDYQLYEMSEDPISIKTREKLAIKTDQLKTEMEQVANSLVEKYWEEVLDELI